MRVVLVSLAVLAAACSGSTDAQSTAPTNGPIGSSPTTALAAPATSTTSDTVDSEAATVSTPEPDGPTWASRLFYVDANLLVPEAVDEVVGLIERAAAVGYTGISLSDTKFDVWWSWTDDDREFYAANVQRVFDAAEAHGLAVITHVLDTTRCNGLLQHDPMLAAGYPIVRAPLVVEDGVLVPVATASLRDGGFERHAGDEFTEWDFQDEPGRITFVDTDVRHRGSASLRIDGSAVAEDAGRIFQTFDAQPFQQYRITAWIRTEELFSGDVTLRIFGGDDRQLLFDEITIENSAGELESFERFEGESLDWSQVAMVFNSLDNERLELGLGVWGARGGTIWWDEIEIEPVPLLNTIERADLPAGIEDAATGQPINHLQLGEPLADPLSGRVPWFGAFDVRHEHPALGAGRLLEGHEIHYSGYHALPWQGGNVTCSWHAPGIASLARATVDAIGDFGPAGVFLNHNEGRSGGWEPADAAYATTGASFAAHIGTLTAQAEASSSGDLYVWSDMFSPAQNAGGTYYLVNGSYGESWLGLGPETIVVTWADGNNIPTDGAGSLQHFAALGHRQIIAGYYDQDPVRNRDQWLAAADGLEGIVGVMYTTFANDYSQLERFAELWWGGVE